MLVKTKEYQFLWPASIMELDSIETYMDPSGCLHFKTADGERVLNMKTNIVTEYVNDEKIIKEKEWTALLKG